MRAIIRALFGFEPTGHLLIKADGGIPGRIRGDLVPAGTLVIVYMGRRFVRTGAVEADGFLVYVEDHKTFAYGGCGAE